MTARFSCLVLLLALAVGVRGQTIWQNLGANPNFSRLVALLNSSAPATRDALNDPARTFTVFAPTDAALTAANITAESNPAALAATLSYHIVNGVFNIDDMDTVDQYYFMPSNYTSPNSSLQQPVLFRNSVVVFGAPSETDRVANIATSAQSSNGNFYGIDKVLQVPQGVSDTLQRVGLTSLYNALSASSLLETVDQASNLTIFAPNNEAFTNAADALSALSAGDVSRVLLGHVVINDVLYSPRLVDGLTVLAANSEPLNFSVSDDRISINGFTLPMVDNILVSNGVIHILDQVLTLPASGGGSDNETQGPTIWESLVANPDFSSLVALLSTPEASDLQAALNNSDLNLTVFAPNNAALDAATLSGDVESVIRYHIVNGLVNVSELNTPDQFYFLPSQLTSDNSSVQQPLLFRNSVLVFGAPSETDRIARIVSSARASNGFLYGIDNVLSPPEGVVETLQRLGFTRLIDALNASNLLETVEQASNLTIFAPNNQAFEDAASDTDGLSEGDLSRVLLGHVVINDVLYSSRLQDGLVVFAASGEPLNFSVANGTITVNGATVIDDILLSNGVLHILDSVILPADLSPLPTSSTGMSSSSTGSSSTAPSSTGSGPIVVSPDGSCGLQSNGVTYVCISALGCCSQYGYCGNTGEYCGAGCQANYSYNGFCAATSASSSTGGAESSSSSTGGAESSSSSTGESSSTASSSTGTGGSSHPVSPIGKCGKCSSHEEYYCPQETPCCSEHGWCGKDESHCTNCQSAYSFNGTCGCDDDNGGSDDTSSSSPASSTSTSSEEASSGGAPAGGSSSSSSHQQSSHGHGYSSGDDSSSSSSSERSAGAESATADSSSSSVSGGAVAGVVVAGVAVVAVAAVVGLFVFKRRRRSQSVAPAAPAATTTADNQV